MPWSYLLMWLQCFIEDTTNLVNQTFKRGSDDVTLMTPADMPEEMAPTEGPTPSCPCESCKLLRFEPSKLKGAVIHNYSFKPRRWNLKSVPNDAYDYHLGVELETDSHFKGAPVQVRNTYRAWGEPEYYTEQPHISSDVSNRVAADMRRPKQLWVTKTDSSVSGPEFVSHPATLSYWKSKKSELKDMFGMLLHAGFRSHDNDNCGMHINISRNAFKDSNHLYRFLTLLHYSPAWSLRMSQRTRESSSHWSPLTGLEKASKRKDICRKAFHNPSWSPATYKYSALNMPPAEEGRFEFRLPRGTLRIDRFFKNLEWTVAMIEYSRHSKVSTSRPIPFMQYVAMNRATYPYLADFIKERGARLEKAVYKARSKPTTRRVQVTENMYEPITPRIVRDGPYGPSGEYVYTDGLTIRERIALQGNPNAMRHILTGSIV